MVLLRAAFIVLFAVMASSSARADVLQVGSQFTYTNVAAAAAVAQPGDTILIAAGTYAGDQYMTNLKGTADAWITIMGGVGGATVQGGGECWHLTDAQYVRINSVHFRSPSSNFVNIDDGGSYDTPAHHIEIESCSFDGGNANNNNADMLKLSGVDDFTVRNCLFSNNPSSGGSGIDMVGCHDGLIFRCGFDIMGANAIQAKGGSRDIDIHSCYFHDAGQRAVNIGGSTGAAFFRPIDINYEASHIDIFSSVFIRSGPVSFVGSVHSRVINNTFIFPERWALRILQETTTPGFLPCSYNTFRNNIVCISNTVPGPAINIGANTQPETFTFSNNLWYHVDNASWQGPNWPVTDTNAIIANPMFVNLPDTDFRITSSSPATGKGFNIDEPEFDFDGNRFAIPRSIGAAEGNPAATRVQEPANNNELSRIEPNPSSGSFVFYPVVSGAFAIHTIDGREVQRFFCEAPMAPVRISTSLPTGAYFLVPVSGEAKPQVLFISR